MALTRLKSKMPTSPQFTAPIKIMMNAIMFAIIINPPYDYFVSNPENYALRHFLLTVSKKNTQPKRLSVFFINH